MKSYKLGLVIMIGTAAVAHAANELATSAPPPALISDTVAGPRDSPVVRAAKRSAAAGRKPIARITDATVAKATVTLSTTSGAADIPDSALKQTPGESAPAAAHRAAAEKRSTSSASTNSGVLVPRAGEFCGPQVSQNTSAPLMAQMPTGPSRAQIASAPMAQAANTSRLPAAQNASSGPSESQNAGPNRKY